jgi:hypothetical protein
MRRPATLRMVSVESGGRVYPDRGNKASNSTTSRTGRAGEHAIQGGGEEILTSWGLPLAEDEAHGGGRGWIRPRGCSDLDWTEITPDRSASRVLDRRRIDGETALNCYGAGGIDS